MAEMIRNTNMENIGSRVQSTVGQVKDKVSDVASDVVDTVQGNRWFSYIGIGLVLTGVGYGIWTLLRNKQDFGRGLDYDQSGDFRSASNY